MDSTMRSNLGVGLPIDVWCSAPTPARPSHHRIEAGEPYFHDLRSRWSAALRARPPEYPRPPNKTEPKQKPNKGRKQMTEATNKIAIVTRRRYRASDALHRWTDDAGFTVVGRHGTALAHVWRDRSLAASRMAVPSRDTTVKPAFISAAMPRVRRGTGAGDDRDLVCWPRSSVSCLDLVYASVSVL